MIHPLPQTSPQVVIVGAGLSGLTCANYLHRAGIVPLVLEKSDAVGGRVRTDIVDGYRYDRGFQVFLPAYPEARKLLDYSRLDLRPFFPGALVWTGKKFARLADPYSRPAYFSSHLFSTLPTISDKIKIARLAKHPESTPRDNPAQEHSIEEELERLGFSETLIERFLRPFLGGVFLDRKLRAPASFFRFVFKMFAESTAAIPAGGMEEIPRQLASSLPATAIRLNTEVAKVDNGAVILSDGETLFCDTVVIATDVSSAGRFAGNGYQTESRGVTCLYYAADDPPVREPILVLNGETKGPVNHVAVMDQVAPNYAPPGKSLVSVSVLGVPERPDDVLDGEARAQLVGWFGADVGRWELLRVYRIPRALPILDSTFSKSGRPKTQGRSILYNCGDYLETPSINGAMASGRIVAESIARAFQRPVNAHATF